jgi:VanZ family protein
MNWKPYLTLGLALAFAVFVAVIIGLADTSSLGTLHRVYDLPYGDKAGHIALNGTLTFLVGLAMQQLRPGNKGLVLRCSLVIMLLATAEEASQVFVPVRSPDWFDLSASYFGIISGTLAALVVHDRVRLNPGLNPRATPTISRRSALSPQPDGSEAEASDAARS